MTDEREAISISVAYKARLRLQRTDAWSCRGVAAVSDNMYDASGFGKSTNQGNLRQG